MQDRTHRNDIPSDWTGISKLSYLFQTRKARNRVASIIAGILSISFSSFLWRWFKADRLICVRRLTMPLITTILWGTERQNMSANYETNVFSFLDVKFLTHEDIYILFWDHESSYLNPNLCPLSFSFFLCFVLYLSVFLYLLLSLSVCHSIYFSFVCLVVLCVSFLALFLIPSTPLYLSIYLSIYLTI